MVKNNKSAMSASIIGGADGPTSIFLVGGKCRSFKQYWHKCIFQYRKKKAVKSIKANPHSMDEVIQYAKQRWNFAEISQDSPEYKAEYSQLRASLILQYKPELLGEFAEMPQLEESEDAVRAFMRRIEERQKKAETVPEELFRIDLRLLEKQEPSFFSRIIFESIYGHISASASGNKKEMKKFQVLYRELYQYYGVSQNDIDQKTERYEELVTTLAQR